MKDLIPEGMRAELKLNKQRLDKTSEEVRLKQNKTK